ncbi:guanylyl cyclase [Plasmodium falciparum RAJ116]|uniref:Guanylyl cyclase n=1 Tax=Plasmodium falciparum RAJ116 TaxID=580058 RepID=A0A0L0CWJ8_PLAFA|nr:guanylyl cyclase [Plasmodium falciparum RAJ116]
MNNETNDHNENRKYKLKYTNDMLLYKLLNNKKNEIFSFQDEEQIKISEFQLKWLVHFDNEIKNAINKKYYENINIEKTNEFLDILKKDYALTTSDNKQSDIRCSKCKKLFNHINDLPNHIFLKHNQFKMKLITETEIQIMKKKFYETPHSFHFLFMMEKKYNYMFKNYNHKNSIFKRNKSFINHNLPLIHTC